MIFQENVPIYVQIANDIKDKIIAGKLAEGEKLSSIREYSIDYEVTALTMQRALACNEPSAHARGNDNGGYFAR